VSGYQPIGGEVLYASYLAATTSVPTASAVTITAGLPPILIPPGYFKNTGSWSSSLQFLMAGLMTATATIPTWNFGLYASVATTSAPAFSSGGVTLGTTGTFTPPGAVTNVPWEMEVQVGLRALALGAASTIVTWGGFRGGALNAAGYVPLPGTGAYTPPATWDTTQGYVLWPGLTLGAATAGNTVTVEYVKLYGEN
jgi:hypothetical protein